MFLGLIGAVFIEIDKAWSTGHRYFGVEEYWRWRAGPAVFDPVRMSEAEYHAA